MSSITETTDVCETGVTINPEFLPYEPTDQERAAWCEIQADVERQILQARDISEWELEVEFREACLERYATA